MFDTIKWLHIEPTARCNAACPGCDRTKANYGSNPNINISDLSVDVLKKIIDNLPNCETLHYCGNVGDIIASKNIEEHILLATSSHVPNIKFHTNGGLRTKEWWAKLPNKFQNKNFSVTFAIDGLEDTNHLYRKRVRWEKLYENVKTFIENGGHAIWQFLLFEHNKHQLLDCYKTSKNLGFKDFICIKNPYTNGDKNLALAIDPKNKKLVMHDIIEVKDDIIFSQEHCFHLRMPSLFVNYRGQVTPCCHLSNTDINSVSILNNFENSNHIPKCVKHCSPNCM